MSERTGNKIWVGIAAGLLTTAVLAMVGIGAYRAGQRSDQTIEVVGQVAGEGDVARTVVVDGWRNGWHGPGPGFFLIPIVIIGLVLLFAGRRGGGPRSGWYGPSWDRERELEDWHRRAHEADAATTTPSPPS